MHRRPSFFSRLPFLLLLVPLGLAAAQARIDRPADRERIIRYILETNRFRRFRHQPEVPRPSRPEIVQALAGELVVRRRDLEEGGLRSQWTAAVYRIDPIAWWITAVDREHYDRISRNIVESFVLRWFDDHFYNYNVLSAPFIAYRHQVLDARANRHLFEASEGRMWEHYWSLADDLPARIRAALSMGKLRELEPDDLDDAVTVVRNDGSWLVLPLPGGLIWVDTFTINNPGGSIPKWIIRKIGGLATRSTFDQYEEWTRDKQPKDLAGDHVPLLSPDGRLLSPRKLRSFLSRVVKGLSTPVSAPAR